MKSRQDIETNLVKEVKSVDDKELKVKTETNNQFNFLYSTQTTEF